MKNKIRKPRPQPPRWYWLDSDGCWDCPNRNNCSGCKKLKAVVVEQKRKQDRRNLHHMND